MADKIDPSILKELIELGDRLTEDRLREIVIAELESNEMDGVAQAYALEEADGDEKKARAYYTKHRVRRIRDLITQESILAEEERAEAAAARTGAPASSSCLNRSTHEARVVLEKCRVSSPRSQTLKLGLGMLFDFVCARARVCPFSFSLTPNLDFRKVENC